MSHCINTSHPEFQKLLKDSKLSTPVLKVKISTWMSKFHLERFPTLTELRTNTATNAPVSAYEVKVTKKQASKELGITVKSSFVNNAYYGKLLKAIEKYNDRNTLSSHYQAKTIPNTRVGADPSSRIPIVTKYAVGSKAALERVNAKINATKGKNVGTQQVMDFDTPITLPPVTPTVITPIVPVVENLPVIPTDNGYMYAGEVYSSKEDADSAKQIDEGDYLIPSGKSQIESVEKIRKQKIESAITKQKELLKTVKDVVEQRRILNTIESLKNLLVTAEQRNVLASNIKAYEDIVVFAKSQLAEIANLLNNNAISDADAVYSQRILNLWKRAGDFSTASNEHIFLDEEEFNTDTIRDLFRGLKNQAEDLENKLKPIIENHLTEFVRQNTNKDVTKEQIYTHLKDVSKLASSTLNISRMGDVMLQAAFNATEYAQMKAQEEVNEVWKTLDELTKKFLKKSGNSYEVLKQKTLNGLESGRLVHRFSPEFFDTRNRLINAAFNTKDPVTGTYKKDANQVKAYFDWVNKNTIAFDVRLLIPDSLDEDSVVPSKFVYTENSYTEKQRNKHINELKQTLGEKGYQYYINRVEKKIEKYKLLRESQYEEHQDLVGKSQEEKDALFNIWLRENSPYWGLDMVENPFNRKKGKDSYFTPKGLREFVEQVPRRVVDGKTTLWYDKNYEKIEADEDLLAYHTFVLETLNKLRYVLPEHKQRLMGVGVIPTVEKSLMDMFQEKGLMMGIIPFWDKIKELQTTTDFSTTLQNDIDPLTGLVDKSIQYNFIEDNDVKVIALVKQKSIEHKQKTGRVATTEDRAKFRAEAKDFLSKQKSWDLTKILKAYSLSILGAKHKAFIEPQMKLLEQAIYNKKELITNKAGDPLTKENEIQAKNGLANLKTAFDFFMDTTYYGIGGRKVEGVTKTKLYTKEEKKRKAKLEELIANEEDPTTKAFLEEQLASLGGFRTMSGVGDTVLKFQTLKGLGWNLTSAMSNIGFGHIANLIESSGGLNYSNATFRKALKLTTRSIGRNLSANTLFNDLDGVATKIRTLMDNWDILQTSNKEMFDTSQNSSLSKLKRFGPYTLQERSEYINQAPIMISVLMEAKATNPEGKKVSLWESLNADGKLKEGYTTEVDMIKLMQKVKRIIEMNHGDYNNALQAKATITGRLLTQFRTWMFEGFANRFESDINLDGTLKVDYNLSYGKDELYVRKGRYHSYTKGQLLTTGAVIGTAVMPGLGTAIGAGAGYLGSKFFGMQTEDNIMSDVLYTLKQLAKKLMLSSSRSTAFDDKFSKQDAANMRKNMTELYILVSLMGIGLLLKALAGDDEDKDFVAGKVVDDEMFAVNILLNQTIRLQTDIGFYTNPLEAEKLTKTAVPMASLVQDVNRVVTDVMNVFNDDLEDDTFESGPFKGNSKALVHTGQLFPFSSQGIRLYRSVSQVFD